MIRGNWSMRISGLEGGQVLYAVDRPRYRFPFKEEKGVLVATRRATWEKVHLEMPLKEVASTRKWFESGDERDLLIENYGVDDVLLEQWYLQGAEVASKERRRSMFSSLQVLHVHLAIKWACKRK